MSHPSYIHLRLHTEYSLSDGILRIKDLCRAASEDQMPAIAVTDLGNLFGMVKFFKEARKYGIKPIIGCDIWVSAAKHADRPSRLILLVQNKNGYLRLCDWVSRSHLNNQKEGKPVLDR
ncbi:MAG: DNA polymerase III subunit alpha, partial [Proteobacteria bacterium]|nr:DNA polymerase III subunit alpha [Pseudomonadota bacterium]